MSTVRPAVAPLLQVTFSEDRVFETAREELSEPLLIGGRQSVEVHADAVLVAAD